MIKTAKFLVSAGVTLGGMALFAMPAYASVGSTTQNVQTSVVSLANTVLSPTHVQVQSTWLYLKLGSTTVPIDPPRLMYNF